MIIISLWQILMKGMEFNMNNYMEKAKQNARKGNNKILSLKQIDREECIEIMKQYKGTIY